MHKEPGVLRFVNEERSKGTTDKEIQHHLLDAGWHMDIIHHALGETHGDRVKAAENAPASSLSKFSPKQYIAAGVAVFILLVLVALFI